MGSRVFEALAEEIWRAGVREAFTFMSEDVVKLAAELDRRGVHVYQARNEHVAVGMADGYARASGRIGLAIVGKGPGVTASLNALLTAARAGSSVLILSGEIVPTPETVKGRTALGYKFVDQAQMLAALGIPFVNLRSPETAVRDLHACLRSVLEERRFLTVNVSSEVLESDAGSAESRLNVVSNEATLPVRPSDVATIADLLEATWASQRPVILAGRGAVRSSAAPELLSLGERIGAVFATTVIAKGFLAESRYAIGVAGTFSTPVASELLGAADIVLAFGASLNPFTTYFGSIFGKARLVQIDTDPEAFSRYQSVDLAVRADARAAAAALVDELMRRNYSTRGYRTKAVADRIGAYRAEETFTDQTGPDGLDPRSLMVALERALPSERTVVVDNGNHMGFSIFHLSVPDPSGFLWPREYGAIGCALGCALGAAVGRPDRLAVLCIGDGGLMTMLGDLDTAVRYRLPLLVVVSNDGALTAERHRLRAHGYPDDLARYANPSLEAVARGLGLEAVTIRSAAEIARVCKQFESTRGPMLLDCHVTTEVVSEFFGLLDRPTAAVTS